MPTALVSHLAGEMCMHAYVYITACSCMVRWGDNTTCSWKQAAALGSRYQLDAGARATCQRRVQMAPEASRHCSSRLSRVAALKSEQGRSNAETIRMLTAILA
jgi:hypothetical protein